MATRSRRKRPSRSLAKFFRREKARIRCEAPDASRAEERIRELVAKHWQEILVTNRLERSLKQKIGNQNQQLKTDN